MPRDGTGTYTLPAGNPVASGTIITSEWANTTMTDIAVALTDSLDRNGRGGMLAPFGFADGNLQNPGSTWINEPTSGQYRVASGDVRMGILGTPVQRWLVNGSFLWNSGNSQWDKILTTADGGTVPPGTTTGNTVRWSGSEWEQTDQLSVLPTGNVGIGTTTPDAVLHVAGNMTVDNANSYGIIDGGGVNRAKLLSVSDDTILRTLGTNAIIFDGGSADERMRITSAGNVGIGTDSPLAQLAVNTAAGGDSLRLTDSVNSTLTIRHASPDNQIQYVATGVASHVFVGNDTERMRINAAGNVVATGAFSAASGTFSGGISAGAATFTGAVQGIVGGLTNGKLQVVAALPGTPDANTIYFVTG